MRIRLVTTLAAVGVALGSLTGINTSASATENNPSCSKVDYNHGDGTCVDVTESKANASASASDTAVSVNGVNLHSAVTVVAFVQAKGATASQMHGKKLRLKKAKTLKTSWRVDRGYGWHMKTYPKGYVFVKGSDGYWHDPKCWNSVTGLPKGKKRMPYKQIKGQIKVVTAFSFSVTSKAVVSDSVQAQAASWANAYNSAGQQTCKAFASAGGAASYYAASYATVRGSVLSSVRAQARGNATKLALKGKSLVDIHASTIAAATGNATVKVETKASCESYLPPPSKRTCKDTYGPGYGGEYPNCHKDGTTTPPPPSNAPGQNPPPADNTSSQCYWETTGEPVAAKPDGTCPTGSFGG